MTNIQFSTVNNSFKILNNTPLNNSSFCIPNGDYDGNGQSITIYSEFEKVNSTQLKLKLTFTNSIYNQGFSMTLHYNSN